MRQTSKMIDARYFDIMGVGFFVLLAGYLCQQPRTPLCRLLLFVAVAGFVIDSIMAYSFIRENYFTKESDHLLDK
jgi:hypothetical protein